MTPSCDLLVPGGEPGQSPGNHVFYIRDRTPLIHGRSAAYRDDVFADAKAHQAGVLRLHVRTQVENVLFENEWRRFLRAARQEGLSVQALLGSEEADFDTSSLSSSVKAIAKFNERNGPRASFSGIHLDVYPYLTHRWYSERQRERVLGDFLKKIDQLSHLAKKNDLQLGVDVPLWWDRYRESKPTEYIANVRFKGVTKPASYHVADLVDWIGLMNFRDQALTDPIPDEDNGMIGHGTRFLSAVSNATVYMRVNVGPVRPPKEYWFLPSTIPRRDFVIQVLERGEGLPTQINGCDTSIFDEADTAYRGFETTRIHVGFDRTTCSSSEIETAKTALFENIKNRTNTSFDLITSLESRDQVISIVDLQSDHWKTAHWSNARPADDDYTGFLVTKNTSPHLSFDGTKAEMFAEIDRAHATFIRFSNYRGIAFDNIERLRELPER